MASRAGPLAGKALHRTVPRGPSAHARCAGLCALRALWVGVKDLGARRWALPLRAGAAASVWHVSGGSFDYIF